MRLYIAEKKEVASAISEALGGPERATGAAFAIGDDGITWLWGHLLRLSDPEEHDESLSRWSLDVLPLTWPVRHIPEERHKGHLQAVVALARKADELVNAGDPDPEGQRLVDEVIEYAELTDKPCLRVLINDNNPDAIRKAMTRMEDNKRYRGLSMSALARAVCDQRYGYNLTRCYTLHGRNAGVDGVLSVGRVQTPILGLVVARDKAHEGHSKKPFYTVQATIVLDDQTITARYQPGKDDAVDDEERLTDATAAQRIASALNQQTAHVVKVQTSEKAVAPPLPHNLLSLQAEAAGLWSMKPKRVLEVTQALRDRHRAITYNRSDCRYLNDERHEEAPALLEALGRTFPQEVEHARARRKSKAFNSARVTAHHAIIPTLSVPVLSTLSDDERQLYHLIVRGYVAQFHADERYRVTVLTLDAKAIALQARGRVDIEAGWRRLYHSDKPETGDQCDLESVREGTAGRVTEARAEEQFTRPPARYTMKTLLQDLTRVAKYVTDPKVKALLLDKDGGKENEAGGIGTPATRDSHIETLFTRGFVAEQGKQVVSTQLGRTFHDALPAFATRPDLTALWHEQQQRIEANELDWQELVRNVEAAVAEEIARVGKSGIKLEGGVTAPSCPICEEGRLRQRKGVKGVFWGCTRYPECRTTFPDKGGKPDLTARKAISVSTGHVCPDCGKGLIRRPSKKKGSFWWGCSGFPKCAYRTFDNGGKPAPSKEWAA